MNEQRPLSIDLRPQCFAEVIGHADIIAALQKKLAQGTVPVAFLFAGPPGVGKTTLSLILARAVQGEGAAGEFDITEVNASDLNGVDDVREMVRNAGYRPLTGRYKVFLLSEAHRLTEPAQNVLLRPLEAKDSSTVWILDTSEPAKLLKPLRDRCLAFTLRPMGEKDIVTLVKRASDRLKVAYDPQFVAGIMRTEVRSAREILMAYEKFAGGIPLDQALLTAEHEPLYAMVAKAVLNGDWDQTSMLLSKIRTADSRAMRSVVAAFLKNDLLKKGKGPTADALANCLLAMAKYNTFEDGIAYSVTVGLWYLLCKQLKPVADERNW